MLAPTCTFMEYSLRKMMHRPHHHLMITTRAAAALLLAIVVLQTTQLGLVRPAPAAIAAAGEDDGMHHLHLFMHDGYPTAVVIVNGTDPALPGTGGLRFGDTTVIDDVLTAGPSRKSRPVGRAQGTYVLASQDQEGRPALLVSMNLVLTDYHGYNGSTVAVMGRNDVMAGVRELSVVGGTGRFRMATGYLLWKTASWRSNNDAVLEFDVFLRA